MPKISGAKRQARQLQILDAATRCFALNGFHRTSMEDIVRESGLSPGAIYCYFRGKHEIVEAISAQRHARDSALLAELTSSPNIGEALNAMSRTLLVMLKETKEKQRRKVSIQFWAESLLDRRIRKIARRGIRQRDRLSIALRETQRKGELASNLDVDAVSRVMLALLQGLILQQAWEPKMDIEKFVTTAVSLISAGLFDTKTGVSSAKSA
ncbi:MAG TPA: TetR/AcrR family transcriptional regulator [Bryobacteraceae bacterium]|jgi:AcrR family transcriptional regulator|nr:TetR/AcrR family transcriptional regulator [Bryobacteraceae bacterium]